MKNMVKYFKWKNIYSFKDEGQISFEVNQNAPQTNAFINLSDQRLSKVEGIFGPNASGKTNVLNILKFIKQFIVESFQTKGQGFNNYVPYMLGKEESSFETGFFIDEIYYVYSFSVDTKKVLSEKLQKKSPQLITVFERKQQQFNGVNFENNNMKNLFAQMVRPNASVISTFSQINQQEMQKIRNFWINRIMFPFYSDKNLIHRIDRVTKEYKNSLYLSKLEEILNNLDLGEHQLNFNKFITETRRTTDSLKKVNFIMPSVVRHNQKMTFELPLILESKGIINLFLKLFPILKAIDSNSLIAIDELDLGIHPQAALRILSLFTEGDNNRGQIVFTTHMTPILMDMNKYQIHLVEKSKDNESEIFRLDQVEGVRPEDNLYKKYMSGVYGGFPDIDF